MTVKESLFGVLGCAFLILCILHRELITFIPFYLLPIAVLSIPASLFFAVPTDSDNGTIDYKDLVVRLFIAGALCVLLLICFGERDYDAKGNVMRIQASQDIHDTYNSWTRKLVMGIDVLKPSVYEESPYDGTTWIKMIVLALAIGGPLMSLAIQGWYLPEQKKRKKRKKRKRHPIASKTSKAESTASNGRCRLSKKTLPKKRSRSKLCALRTEISKRSSESLDLSGTVPLGLLDGPHSTSIKYRD